MDTFARRRAEFAQRMGDAVAVIPAAPHHLRNNDTEYEYRQDSTFYYLTGFLEPEAVLVLAPRRTDHQTILFVRPRDREREIWVGKRAGVEGAIASYGAQAAFPIGELAARLPDYLLGAPALYYACGNDETSDRLVFTALKEARFRERRGGVTPDTVVEPGRIVHEMRLVKDGEELATMRRAAAISDAGHVAAMRATKPGLYEYEIEAIIESAYRANGAQDVAYPSIVAGGSNATILHYNSNRDRLRAGDLLLVDSGCELDLYASDVTRTWPVSGRFSAEQRALYEIVLAAQTAAIDEVRPGKAFNAYHDKAVDVLTDGLLDLGLLKGSRQENIEQKKYRDFYPHSTGHWIGLDVHDVGRYKGPSGEYRALASGMVLTVEPGIYVQNDLDCDERFKGIGIRIEDDVLCTAEGPDVLTARIPKAIADVEAIVGARA